MSPVRGGSLAICSKEERVIYLDYFIFILIKWQLPILTCPTLGSYGWKATGSNSLMGGAEDVPPGAGAGSPLHGPSPPT